MPEYIFEFVPFKREIMSYKGLKAFITSYGKIIRIFHYNDDETKPIQYFKVLIVHNMETFVRLENYWSINETIEHICCVVDYSENRLPHELDTFRNAQLMGIIY